jgi:homogentisate phytyltransferase/homogentisate geranylgeranyltransferase
MSQIFLSKTWQRALDWLYALWKFSRPHTIIGTSLSVLGLYWIAVAVIPGDVFSGGLRINNLPGFSGQALLILIGAWIACLCGNVYIVGLNQLEDVAIDRINKPDLPLASGEFSRTEGVTIVTATGTLALLLALIQGPFLLATVGLSLGIGTVYSLPPIRLKRFPFWAALCIFGVRGVIVNLGLFLHFNQCLGGARYIPPEVWALTVFVVIFTFAIAIFKDIPDIDGDRQYNISTLTIKLGAPAVFNLARWVLTACYLGMIVVTCFWLPAVQPLFLIAMQLLALILLWFRSLRINLKDKQAIANFYQFIWKLFFLQYLIFPTACLLG